MAQQATKEYDALVFTVCLAYGARQELVEAIKGILWILLIVLAEHDHVRPDRTGPGRPGLGRLVLFAIVQGRSPPALIRKRIGVPGYAR